MGGPRVALAAVGDPRSPETWSGITAGLLGALTGLGVQVRPVDLRLPPGLEHAMLAASALASANRYDAQSAALTTAAREALARRRIPGSGVDGVIQIGATVSLPDGVPYVTLEDMTLRLASQVHPVFRRMSPRALARSETHRALIYDRARMATVASHWAAQSLLGDYGLPPGKVAVVGFGANHRAEPPERDWSTPRFLFVGVDWERKGGPMLMRAFARLRASRPDALLDVVGAHPALSGAGVSTHGVLYQSRPGDRDAIAGLFARATCLVMPSLVEPFGIVHVEAGSAGIPSIASSVGGPRDVIGGDGGLLVDPGDERGLLEAMGRMCEPELASRMGRAAHERAREYTWTRVAERLLRALALPAGDGRALAEFL